ncbi:hypothetical protein OIU79_027363 [Salix purpurea]|uniref:Prolamin-like domain-containing protein n=1 Tax=Salix purpurea TaxID=77065 RepID=A0A9Q0VUS4_SALPP|nr:hypothetical protein OIU79_027363 [Salix purpurea]
MAAFKNLALFLSLTLLISTDISTAARDILMNEPGSIDNLSARLEEEGSLVECWSALVEIKSCTNEIVLFFMNGEADIGPDCCRAIHTITHNCWPAMFTSLGFTNEEGNILRGYCDASPPSSSIYITPAGAPSPLSAGAPAQY